jgi:hypothetical protein
MKCPLISSEYGVHNCVAPDCGFNDETGDCLIKQALQCYVSAEHARVAEKNDRLRRETELAKTYWALKKDGTRSPIHFIERGDPLPDNAPHGTIVVEEY